MIPTYKAIIIGTSLSGKTTLISFLKKSTVYTITEMDEELKRKNNGVFPNDDIYKNTVLAPQIIRSILQKKCILFFTNAQYFSESDLTTAKAKGFRIIQLIADKETMLRRNAYRMEHDAYEDHSKYLDAMIAYQHTINHLVDARIDSTQTIEMVAKQLLSSLFSCNSDLKE